jgi:hypothetical protein
MAPTPVIRLNYSGIRLGRSEKGQQLAVPWRLAKDVNAATVAVHAQQSVLTFSATKRHLPNAGERPLILKADIQHPIKRLHEKPLYYYSTLTLIN